MAQQLYYTKIVIENSSKWRTSYIKCSDNDCFTCKPFCKVKKKPSHCEFIKGPDCCINKKKIDCCFIQGRVLCEFDGCPVSDAIVFATSKSDCKVFTGITNRSGEYCICVPKGDRYIIRCFFCTEDCFASAPCICGEVNTCC
ncbi:MAG: hypothetical protein N4A62_17155 [Marinisporobacter sp.]|nr:hypothetical protein [Marinisporobacter sp.]